MNNYLCTFAETPTPDVRAVVFAICPQNPFDELKKIERTLCKSKIKGKILFDMLLANGSRTNRFFIADFDGQHIALKTLKNADDNYSSFSEYCTLTLSKNTNHLDDSLLSNAMKYALRIGTPF
ncbi:type II toxin-antitoxin system RnlB family antitoxin [Pseudomonas sp. RG1]|jgi:hypothetical protein|uniref:type II toxin-antitoxin system RnlB family antitoxin n=1 Tax=Pseudomonas sp. RG1 TaxID=2981602 RepID=UPI0039B562C3